MRILLSLLALAVSGVGVARAQAIQLPPGAYRTAGDYAHRRPQPGGTDAFYPDKRGQLVVVVPQGAREVKRRIAPDSVWGYVSGKGRAFRIYRGEEYRLLFADTLCVYSSNTVLGEEGRMGRVVPTPGQFVNYSMAAPKYFFSAGLKGLIFPLTPRFLRELYAASNPAFVARLAELKFDESLTDFDPKTGLYRVTTLYRETTPR